MRKTGKWSNPLCLKQSCTTIVLDKKSNDRVNKVVIDIMLQEHSLKY